MKHAVPVVLDKPDEDAIAAVRRLLEKGIDHLPREVIPSVSDEVGRGLCRIGFTQSPVSPGAKSGKEDR